MTYRLIKLLDRLHLEACTCFIGLDTGLKSFITLFSLLLSPLSASTSPGTTSKAEFIKLTVYHQWKLLLLSAFAFFWLCVSVSFISSMSASWKAEFFFFGKWKYRTSIIKTAFQTNPLHPELSLLPWWILRDSGIFSENQPHGVNWCGKPPQRGKFVDSTVPKAASWTFATTAKDSTISQVCGADVIKARR